ncbi:hypothetical protein [Mycolicibacterium porcinum]|uniref:Uncharacterized protein n=1 Tax=Mycolicibacterium porcinum TaxID=39693 RepID=A0AAW5SY55_9MYCO|nr:hypothetical protein [Mycolicibacterium porcinum]MCV7387357.1 hypothetical protein [Mycolicibacterium porcinum]OCB43126.1 hypothetical protein A5721_25510 [Mycolicibacterium vulneris]ORB42768.1 hypothetical protein BST41_08895 [Mycolicibacterium porcinum]CDO31770.1 hypothetical protein BN979_04585 [Mycolicibacterium vulneris]
MLAQRINKLLDVLALLPIYAVIIYTFWLPGYEKLFDRDRTVPYYAGVFEDSILNRLNLTNILITSMGVLELVIVVVAVVSLVRREFVPGASLPFFKLALFLSATAFAMLGFGLRLIQNHAGTANQFYYFGFAVFFLALVQYRESRAAKA